MIKVKNAIILAAGRGSRLKELTTLTPKPLLKPGNNSFISQIIKNLKDKGIENIYVVVGYLGDKFYFLEKQGIKIIKNSQWNKGNNITSIKAAMDILGDSLIINGDIVMEENIFKTEYNSSLTYVERNSNIDEWIVNVDESGNILEFDKKGLNKKGLYQREIIFVTQDLADKAKSNIKDFDVEEYQEFLFLNTAKENKIDFKVHEIAPGTVYDLDTVEEFERYRKNYFK